MSFFFFWILALWHWNQEQRCKNKNENMPWHKMSRHMIVESVWHTVGINSVQLLEIQDCFGCLITQFLKHVGRKWEHWTKRCKLDTNDGTTITMLTRNEFDRAVWFYCFESMFQEDVNGTEIEIFWENWINIFIWLFRSNSFSDWVFQRSSKL